mmetsp:Transcript_33716/g.66628  ORF Transcript_33716/g.66628 Transcript_33716/m.66628 type:complete len:118 (+) Transcript_33716:228-581(+)
MVVAFNFFLILNISNKKKKYWLLSSFLSCCLSPSRQDMPYNILNSFPQVLPDLCKNSRPIPSHLLRITIHEVQVCPDSLSEICLINNEDIRLRNTWPTFARHFVSSSHVNHIQSQVR